MADLTPKFGESIPDNIRVRWRDMGDGTHALVYYVSGSALGTVNVREIGTYTLGVLTTRAMGNGATSQIVPANPNRKALWIANVSDVAGYFSWGDGTGLTINNYTFRLFPGQSLVLEVPIPTQALISANIGVAGKNVCYQEGT